MKKILKKSITQLSLFYLPLFLLAIPFSLNAAKENHTQLHLGLISCMIASFIASLVSKNPHALSGPAVGISSFYLLMVQKVGIHTSSFILVLAGLLQILYSYLNLGILIKFIPTSIIQGMIVSIFSIVLMKQFSHLFGNDLLHFSTEDYLGNFENTISFPLLFDFANFEVHLGSLLLSLISLVVLFYFDQRMKLKLGMFFLTMISIPLLFNLIGISALSFEQRHFLQVPSFELRMLFHYEHFFNESISFFNPQNYYYALILSLLLSFQSLMSLSAFNELQQNIRPLNEKSELKTQGLSNLIAGFLGALPISITFIRSSLFGTFDIKSKWVVFWQGIFILVVWIFFNSLLNQIPISALASIIIYLLIKLFPVEYIRSLKSSSYEFKIPFMVTSLISFISHVLYGLCGGLVSSLFIQLKRSQKASIKHEYANQLHHLYFLQDMSFIYKNNLEKIFNLVKPGEKVLIESKQGIYIDPDILNLIRNFRTQAQLNQIEIIIGGIPFIESTSEEFNKSMQKRYLDLLQKNKEFVAEKTKIDPDFFKNLSLGQAPEFLFIGCSDSRVPIENITKTAPGEIFVHRNIANIVSLTDINMLSVLQYSVEVLKVKHIIVFGHYGCGGVRAALSQTSLGLIDNWISQIKWVVKTYQDEIESIQDPLKKEQRIIELHVQQQVRNLYKTSIVQNAIKNFNFPALHGWVYDLESGYIKDLNINLELEKDFLPVFHFKK